MFSNRCSRTAFRLSYCQSNSFFFLSPGVGVGWGRERPQKFLDITPAPSTQ